MIPRIPTKSSPQMADAAVEKIQKYLATAIPWLDHVFGICERQISVKDGVKFISANAFVDNRYIQVMPCGELGNFCFFSMRDPQSFGRKDIDVLYLPFSLIFWYNVDKCSSSPDKRNLEAIKAQIMAAVSGASELGLIYSLGRVYNKVESIFNDYTYDVTTNQYMMHPYSGVRVDGELRVEVPCYDFPKSRGAFDKSYDESYDITK